jgi:cytoskeletal protein CcmA (bactofilin family)
MNLNNLTSGFAPDTTSGSSKNVLASDVDIKGTIKFDTELIFDGKLEGEIFSEDGNLTLSKNADVHGELKTKSIVVYGSISVLERAELKSTSQLTGNLKAMRIVIEEGAIFVGKLEVTPKSSAERSGISADHDQTRKIQPAPVTA